MLLPGGWLVALALHGALAGAAASEKGVESAGSGVEVRFLANEGFLLRAETGAVLIDAFVLEPFSVYQPVPEDVLVEMFAGGAPFANVRVALVSHRHRDHFQPDVAARYLREQLEPVLASSPEVIQQVRPLVTGSETVLKRRLQAVLPEPGTTVLREFGGIRVEFLRLLHGGSGNRGIQNLGHIVHLGGRTVLHIGDAAATAENFAPYELAARKIDVALIPYWYFLNTTAIEVVYEHLVAAHRIAVHVPPRELESVRDTLARRFPGVYVFERPLDFRRF